MSLTFNTKIVDRVCDRISLYLALSSIFVIFHCLTKHVVADEPSTGRSIYLNQCVKCHGKEGQGVEGASEEALRGTRTLIELTELVDETMPEDDADLCTGEDAKLVAQYMLDHFYNGNHDKNAALARVKLSHLTKRQYSQSMADIFSHFLGSAKIGTEEGLRAEYFDGRSQNSKNRVVARVDHQVDFDFGDGKPVEEIKDVAEFSMSWRGSVIAEQSGPYEFTIETVNGTKLWVNHDERPLIDAWVASKGEAKQYHGTVQLIAGRAYPLRLDLFKYKEDASSIKLMWKQPKGVQEVIPRRCLRTQSVPMTFVISTPFPADDSSDGYERGTSVSQAWEQATTAAAIEAADTLLENAEQVYRRVKAEGDDREQARQLCLAFAELAFRRPLTEVQRQLFVDKQFATTEDLDSAIKRSMLFVLKSPFFLYPGLKKSAANDEEVDSYSVATQLALEVWDSIPDRPLLSVAEQGKLNTPERVAMQTKRMLADPRAHSKVRSFFHHWLDTDEKEELPKDKSLFPEFNERLVADLRTSLDLFIDEVVWSDASDYRQLLLADYLYLNDRMAHFYGGEKFDREKIDGEKSAGENVGVEEFERTSFPAGQRAGIVTHPFLMANFAYHDLSSPVHRGVWVTRRLLERSMMPPPQATEFKAGDFDPSLTTRQKTALLTKSDACQSCHRIINPLGFSMENFDAVGRYRSHEGENLIDSKTNYTDRHGKSVEISGALGMAQFLSESHEAHGAFVDQLFHHLVKQPINAFGPSTRNDLIQKFAETNYNIQQLMVEVTKVSVLHQANQ